LRVILLKNRHKPGEIWGKKDLEQVLRSPINFF